MVGVALVVALALTVRRMEETGRPREWATQGVFISVLSGVVGARLLWNVQHGGVDELLKGGGLVWYGGMAGALVGGLAWGFLRRVPVVFMLDAGAPAIAAGYAIGRIGCQLSGDGDYGVPTDVPWAMGYPDGTVPTPPGVEVHPTPVYETLVMGVAAVWLWRKRDAFPPGVLFVACLAIAGAERFAVEFVRRNADVVAGLTLAQLQSLALVVLCAGAAAFLVRQQTNLPEHA